MGSTHVRHTVTGYGIRIEDRRQNGSFEPTTYWTRAEAETRTTEFDTAGQVACVTGIMRRPGGHPAAVPTLSKRLRR